MGAFTKLFIWEENWAAEDWIIVGVICLLYILYFMKPSLPILQ